MGRKSSALATLVAAARGRQASDHAREDEEGEDTEDDRSAESRSATPVAPLASSDAAARMQRVYHEVLRPKQSSALRSSDSAATLDSETPSGPSAPPSALPPRLRSSRQRSERPDSPTPPPVASGSRHDRRVEFAMPESGRGRPPLSDKCSESSKSGNAKPAGGAGSGFRLPSYTAKSRKAELLLGVDDAMVHYMDETLLQSDTLVFNKYTRGFLDPTLEALYQAYTAVDWFPRARWHMALWVSVHAFSQIIFAVLPASGFRGMTEFVLSYHSAPAALQWAYLPLALPFAALPAGINPFQTRWRAWVCVISMVFITTFEVWLAHANHLAVNNYADVVRERMQCQANNTNIAPFLTPSSSSPINETVAAAALTELSKEQSRLAVAITRQYAGALVQLLVGFASLFAFLFAISIRLEFVQVGVVALTAVIVYAAVISSFQLRIEWLTALVYAVAVVLLLILSYSSDRTIRRSFLSNFLVEKENEQLKSTLKEAEAALLNEPARDEEREVVERILGGPDNRHLEAVRIPFENLTLLQAIGRGAMGDVIKARYHGTVVVCKRLRREHLSATAIVRFRDEMELMAGLRHPNVVQLIGASWDNCSNLCLVLEYLEHGDIHGVLHSRLGAHFSWSDPLLKMAIDVVQGMLYLHSQEPPVVHRDLKSVNIMCSTTFGCKVGDFGLSRRFGRRKRRHSRRMSQREGEDGEDTDRDAINALTTLVGTPFWLAPELIRSETYGPAADVFSFGIVLSELETRQTPYHDVRDTGLKVLMRIAHSGLRPTLPPSCLPHRRALIEDCWQDDPARRPTFAQVLERLQGPVLREMEGHATRELGQHQRRVLLPRETTAPPLRRAMTPAR